MLRQLVELLWDEDHVIASRAANAVEKVSRTDPALLQPWKAPLLASLAEAERKPLRWSLASIVPRLKLSAAECEEAAALLYGYLEDTSSIVKTLAMEGLVTLSQKRPQLLPEVLDMVRILTRSGTPAMRARGRALLRQLETRPSNTGGSRKRQVN